MKVKKGDRVGAILSAENDHCKFLGFGIYDGAEVPPANVDDLMHSIEIPSPKILLDDGQIVWGFECWWAGEEKIKKMLTKYEKIERVTIQR